MMEIRLLQANEIDVRVKTISEKGYSVLLYKDARVDMAILDEVFGMYGWQRKHDVVNGNLFCTVSIYDKDTKQWIEKQDVGVESYTEKEKGQASDSFKRACFNIGIGRELYTCPKFIWIYADGDINKKDGKWTTYTKLKVDEIGYNEHREIDRLIIVDDKGKIRYRLNGPKPNQTPSPKASKALLDQMYDLVKIKKIQDKVIDFIQDNFNKSNSKEMTEAEVAKTIEWLKGE